MNQISTETLPSEAEMRAEWNRNNGTPPRSKFNRIAIDHKYIVEGLDAEGKPADVINQNFGQIYLYKYDEEGNETVTMIDKATAEFVPLRWRWHSVPKNIENKLWYTKEVNQFSPIEVYDANTKEVVATGKHSELKEEYDLKLQTVVYMAHNGDIYKFIMSPGNWENNQRIERELKSKGQPYSIRFKTSKATTGTSIYAAVDYELANPIEFASVYPYMKLLDNILGEVPAYTPPAAKPLPTPAPVKSLEQAQADDDIVETDVKDLPF